MKQIIILILALLFTLYLYRKFQLRFAYQIDKDIKILQILIFLLSIYAFFSGKWWINILVLILIIALITSPNKFVNLFRKAFNNLGNLFKIQKN